MIEYTPGRLQTPGGKWVPVNIASSNYRIKQAGRPYVVRLLDDTGVHFTSEVAKECVDQAQDCFIIVTGKRAGGKSTLIQGCAKGIDRHFDPVNVAFRLEDFGEIFNNNPQGDGQAGIYPQVIMDEAGYAMYGPQWLKREQQVVAKELIVSRIKRQIIWMAMPKRKHLNPHVRDMAYLWIHVSQPKPFQRGYAVVRMAPEHLQSEFASESFWEPKYAFTFPEQTGPQWDAYEARKIAFVNNVLKESLEDDNGTSKSNAARDAILREYYQDRKSRGDPITMKELGEIIGVNESRVSQILSSS